MYDFAEANRFIKLVEDTQHYANKKFDYSGLKVGVDLGTAYIVIVVLSSDMTPLACEMEFSQVVKDGLVVDFVGAQRIVRRLKEKIENKLGTELSRAAIAVPPGTGERDAGTHRYVVEGAGLEVTDILDEPTAANSVLKINNGAVVDIGGGTTGLSIFKNGEVVYTADEPTGGTHLTLVIAGNYKIKFEEAEELKIRKDRHKEIYPLVVPVLQKMASIVRYHTKNYNVEGICLVGGTSCIEGIEDVFIKETGIYTQKPYNPLLVTPVGIAMNCR